MTSPQSKSADVLKASATNGAALALSQNMHEGAEAEGTYYATCWFPRAQDVNKYIKTRDMAQEIYSGGIDCVLRNLKRLDYLDRKLEAFHQDFEVQWSDIALNTVATVGKNYALDGYLQTAVTITGPYMGLISSTSFSAISAADTMASHAGWLEAGATNAPTYTSPRKTCAWSAASAGSKSLSSSLSFAMTGTGTVKGCFIVLSTGAVSTIDNTSGTLYSAGLFTGGDQPVVNGNTLSVSYSTSL